MRKERKEALESFLVRLGVTMQDLSLMDTALTHSSYAYECKEKVVPEFNQRLEFWVIPFSALLSVPICTLPTRRWMKERFPSLGHSLFAKRPWRNWLKTLPLETISSLAEGNVTWVAVTILPSWQMPLNPLWERTTLMQDMKGEGSPYKGPHRQDPGTDRGWDRSGL